MKRFLNSISVSYEDLEANNYHEIEWCWFWFNKHKTPSEASPPTTAVGISSALNDNLTIGDKVKVRLTYGGSTRFFVDNHIEKWTVNSAGTISSIGLNAEDIMNTLHSTPWIYIANIVENWGDRTTVTFNSIATGIGEAGADYPGYDGGRQEIWENNLLPNVVDKLKSTPATTTSIMKSTSKYNENSTVELFALALLDTERSCFEPTLDADGNMQILYRAHGSYGLPATAENADLYDNEGNLIIESKDDISIDKLGLSSSYTEEYEYTFKGSSSTHALIENIQSNMANLSIRDRRNMIVIDTMQKQMMSFLRVESLGENIVSSWDEYFQGDQLIKEKVDSMKRYQFINLLSDCLDTGFETEKASIWEKVFAVIIVIAAVVVTIFTYGAMSPSIGGVAALAMGLGYSALVLTIGSLILSQMGASAMSLVKIIGKVAQIVGLAAMITGLMAAVQNAFNAAAETAKTAGTITSTSQYTVGSFIKDTVSKAFSSATDSITSLFDVLTDPMGALFGSEKGVAKEGISGWLGRLENGMKAYTRFMNNSATTENEAIPTEDQMTKKDFQHPDQMYDLSEQMIYEPDALQKMSIMKDQQFGGNKTESIMERIA